MSKNQKKFVCLNNLVDLLFNYRQNNDLHLGLLQQICADLAREILGIPTHVRYYAFCGLHRLFWT